MDGHRATRTLLAAVAAAVLALPLVAAPVLADWAGEDPAPGVVLAEPSLVVDGSGDFGVAWLQRGTEPGILFATDAGGAWATERVADGEADAVGAAVGGPLGVGAAFVAYTRRGAGSGLYLTWRHPGGTWEAPWMVRADESPGGVSVVVDASGAFQLAYASEGLEPGVWFWPGTGQPWVRITTGTWDRDPSLVLDAAGHAHIAFARQEPGAPAIYVATNAGGSWVTTRATACEARCETGPDALAVDAAGRHHVAARARAGVLGAPTYVTDQSGIWVATDLEDGSTAFHDLDGAPAIGIDPSGEPEIVASLGTALVRYDALPAATHETLATPSTTDWGWPSIVRDPAGRLAVAYAALGKSPGIWLHREDPAEDVLLAAAVTTRHPSLRLDAGDRRHLAFERRATDGSDGIAYAEDTTGAWVETTISAVHGPPDLALGEVGARYVALSDRVLVDETGTWQEHLFAVAALPAGAGAVVAAGNGTWHAAYGVAMTVRVVDEAFVEEEIPVWSDGYLRGRPALIEDAGGMPVLAYAVPEWDGAIIRGFVRTPAGWAPRLSIGCSWTWCREREPALAAGSVPGTAWIAWAGTGIKVALWHHSDAVPAGAKPMPLTRSSSDRTPDVALAPGGSVVVAWARACAAPDPGLYLATNRSGRWVISRVVAGCGIEDPSLAVRLDGRIVIAFTNGDAGVRVLTEAAAP